jgi:protein-tyrosine phosphatase
VSGFIDLHCHYLPAIDDGVRTLEEGVQLLEGLARLGYTHVVATPHIRTAMFENRKDGLERTFTQFAEKTGDRALPQLGLGAEHFCDDVFWDLFSRGQAVPYPGGKAALVELPYERMPQRVEEIFFEMNLRGVRAVLAHPERYADLYKSTDRLDPILEVGALAQLDLMSLVGRYGSKPQRTAERMLDEGVYYIACSDAHKPGDVELVAKAIERLRKLAGREEADELMAKNPARVLSGDVDP